MALNLGLWSTTPLSNSTVGSINFAENQLPSTLNNSARQAMADIRDWYDQAEWIDGGYSISYVSASVFKFHGTDRTALAAANRRVRAGVGAGTIYGTIASASLSASDTQVTVTWDSGSLDASLSAIALGILHVTNRSVAVTGTGKMVLDTAPTISGIIAAGGINVTATPVPANGWYLSGANTLDFSTNTTNRGQITTSGHFNIGTTANLTRLAVVTDQSVAGGPAAVIRSANGTQATLATFYVADDTTAPNAGNTVLGLYKANATGRSLNSAGSNNAAAADAAEIHLRRDDCGNVAKGDICATDRQNMVTDQWQHAVCWRVKSTDPGYVLNDKVLTDLLKPIGICPQMPSVDFNDKDPNYEQKKNDYQESWDAWKVAYDDWQTKARDISKKVDRIVKAGMVPLNLSMLADGSLPEWTVGQWVIPSRGQNGRIAWIAKNDSDMSLLESIHAVGKICGTEVDGRPTLEAKGAA